MNWNSSGTTPAYGTYAYIYAGDPDPQLCTSDSDSSVWTMLSGGGSCQYAQSGFLKAAWLGHTGRHRFVESSYSCSLGAQIIVEPSTTCCWSQYRTSYIEQIGKVRMWWNTTVIAETAFDPAVVWTPPWKSYWSGETFYPGDDMPGQEGVGGMPAIFNSLQRRESVRGGWVTPSSSLTLYSHGCLCYKKQWITQNASFKIWTQR